MSGRRCVVCRGAVAARAENPAFPFCSSRCKQIDLGKWLGAEYVISRSLMPESAVFGQPWGQRGED